MESVKDGDELRSVPTCSKWILWDANGIPSCGLKGPLCIPRGISSAGQNHPPLREDDKHHNLLLHLIRFHVVQVMPGAVYTGSLGKG